MSSIIVVKAPTELISKKLFISYMKIFESICDVRIYSELSEYMNDKGKYESIEVQQNIQERFSTDWFIIYVYGNEIPDHITKDRFSKEVKIIKIINLD